MSLNILSVCAEFAPLVKVGGLADVTSGLARYLHSQGYRVVTLLPRYGEKAMATEGKTLAKGSLLLAGEKIPYSFLQLPDEGTGEVILLDSPALSGADIYSAGDSEARRFLTLSLAAIPLCKALNWRPDVLHCHDWHTAMTLQALRSDPDFKNLKCVLTIHNIGYQGVFPAEVLDETPIELPGTPDDTINFLAAGIDHADAITTVSPTHAAEILTPEYGMGLELQLQQHSKLLTGILNGVDYSYWDPATDELVAANYNADNTADKFGNKQALVRNMGFDSAATPLVGMVTRLVYQKGSDLLVAALPGLFASHELNCVVLGDGDPVYMDALTELAAEYPARLKFVRAYDESLAHQIMAGADILAVPSRYEPCGLTQMYAMRYGTVPVVRKTGGLADSVRHFDPGTGQGTGVVFEDADPGGLAWGLSTALEWFADKALWNRLVNNGMSCDFSWDKQGPEYERLYRNLVT